jgi:hypothetical protein
VTAADERVRRVRTTVSAALLIAGTAAFWVSLPLTAVSFDADLWSRTRPASGYVAGGISFPFITWGDCDGWDWFVRSPLTAGNTAFLASAFLLWAGAAWFRSAWARWIGAAGALATVVVTLLQLGTMGAEYVRPAEGWWLWMAASVLIGLAFLVLPAPVRPPPGERLPRAEADRARRRLAWIVGGAALVLLLASHALLEVRVTFGQLDFWRGTVQWRQIGEPLFPRIDASQSLVFDGIGKGWTSFAEMFWVLVPVVFALSAQCRSSYWRLIGIAWAVVLVVVQFGWLSVPWYDGHDWPSPSAFLWYGPPIALVVAFLLLPPRRDAADPAAASAPGLAPRPSPERDDSRDGCVSGVRE